MIALGWPRPRRLTHLLAFACVGLAGIVALELTAAPGMPPSDQPPTHPPATAAGSDTVRFAMPPADSYAEIETRPLFSNTRRPSAFAAATAQAHPNFVLVGTILSHDERDALIKHGQPARVDHVTEGQAVDGWTVDSILPDRVIFTNAGARLEVKAKESDAAPASRGRKQPNTADASAAPTNQ